MPRPTGALACVITWPSQGEKIYDLWLISMASSLGEAAKNLRDRLKMVDRSR